MGGTHYIHLGSWGPSTMSNTSFHFTNTIEGPGFNKEWIKDGESWELSPWGPLAATGKYSLLIHIVSVLLPNTTTQVFCSPWDSEAEQLGRRRKMERLHLQPSPPSLNSNSMCRWNSTILTIIDYLLSFLCLAKSPRPCWVQGLSTLPISPW